MNRRRKSAQEYSAEDFDAVVALIRGDSSLRADIEAITGQQLQGRSPRELFDLFRAIDGATDIQLTVARYGQARRLVRETRVELAGDLAEHIADHPDVHELARRRLKELEMRADELKAERDRLKDTNRALMSGAAPVAGQLTGRAESA